MKQLIVSLLLSCMCIVSCSSSKGPVEPGTTSVNSDVSTNNSSNRPSVEAETPTVSSKPDNTQGENNPHPPSATNDTAPPTVSAQPVDFKLASSWHGDWEDFSVETNGDFVKDRVRYKWIGSRSQLTKKPGCWAFYDGVTSKADWVWSLKRSKWDKESKRNLAQLSNECFKPVTLVCTEKNGEEIPIGADCIYSGYFKDNDVIYEPTTCQIDDEFEIYLRKIMRK